MMNINNPTVITGPHYSDTLFKDHNECKAFVSTITKSDVFVNNKFTFGTPDGSIFNGGCFTASEWEEAKDQLGL